MEAGLVSDWMGTLVQDNAELRVLVHIRQLLGKAFDGCMDNLDVGRMGIPITVDEFENSTLRFTARTIDGSYAGRISRDAQKINGTWSMDGDDCPLILRPVKPSAVDGIWAGTLDYQTFRLRLVFYIASGPDGMIAAMKSRDQGDGMVPMSSANRIGSTVVLEAETIRGRFAGRLDDELSTIEGLWTQSGVALPLVLKRIANEEEPARPQDPISPYPYREEEVKYRNQRADLELAGTFTIPEGDGPFPAVLLIAGSGALDRNESMNGHRPFLVLADWLTRRGTAVLRVDKRGVGESDGELIDATTTDFATDAEEALRYLGTRSEVDAGRIGMVGHSEGGLIACMVAARNRDVAFVVLLAAPGVSGWELAGQQARLSAEIYGLDPNRPEERNIEVRALLRDEKDESVLRRKLQQKFSDIPELQRSEVIKTLMLPWHRHFAGLNPADYIERLKCPVLGLNGERDVSVESKSNLAAIRQALKYGGNQNFEAIELPGLNHLFQTCTTGLEAEYGQIEETFAPVALEKTAQWIGQCIDQGR